MAERMDSEHGRPASSEYLSPTRAAHPGSRRIGESVDAWLDRWRRSADGWQ